MCPDSESKWDKMKHFGSKIDSAWLPFGHNFGIMRFCPARSNTTDDRAVRGGTGFPPVTLRMRMRMRAAEHHQTLPKVRGVLQHTIDDVVSTLLTVMRRHRSQSRADARMQRDLLLECPHARNGRNGLMPRTTRPGFSCDQRPVVHPCSMMEKWMARQHYESASLRMRTDSTGSQRPAYKD